MKEKTDPKDKGVNLPTDTEPQEEAARNYRVPIRQCWAGHPQIWKRRKGGGRVSGRGWKREIETEASAGFTRRSSKGIEDTEFLVLCQRDVLRGGGGGG